MHDLVIVFSTVKASLLILRQFIFVTINNTEHLKYINLDLDDKKHPIKDQRDSATRVTPNSAQKIPQANFHSCLQNFDNAF